MLFIVHIAQDYKNHPTSCLTRNSVHVKYQTIKCMLVATKIRVPHPYNPCQSFADNFLCGLIRNEYTHGPTFPSSCLTKKGGETGAF